MSETPSLTPAADLLRLVTPGGPQTTRAPLDAASIEGTRAAGLARTPSQAGPYQSLFATLLKGVNPAQPAPAVAATPTASFAEPVGEIVPRVELPALLFKPDAPIDTESGGADLAPPEVPERPGTGPPVDLVERHALLTTLSAGGTILPPSGAVVPDDSAKTQARPDLSGLELSALRPSVQTTNGRPTGSAGAVPSPTADPPAQTADRAPTLDLGLTDGRQAPVPHPEIQPLTDRPSDGRPVPSLDIASSAAEREPLDIRHALPATLTQKAPLLELQRPPQTVDVVLSNERAIWPEQMANRIALLVQREANTASLRLHPPSLGRIDVRIAINNDQANVWLAAPVAEVRDMLGQTLARLDNLLASAGIELAEAEVGTEEFDQHMASDDERSQSEPDSNPSATTRDETPETSHVGLLDTYA